MEKAGFRPFPQQAPKTNHLWNAKTTYGIPIRRLFRPIASENLSKGG